MTFEHAPWRKKGLYTGITQAGFPVGLLLANFAFLISVPLGEQWAWRVPFLLSRGADRRGHLHPAQGRGVPGVRGAQGRGRARRRTRCWRCCATTGATSCARSACASPRPPATRCRSPSCCPTSPSEKLAGRPITLTATDDRGRDRHLRHHLLGRLTDRIGRRPVYLLGTAIMVAWGIPLFLVVNTGAAVADRRRVRHQLHGLPELAGRRAGRLVLRAVQRQHPHHRRLAGLPAVRRRLRLHPAGRHRALRRHRLDRPGAAVQRLRPARPARRPGDPRDLGPDRARRGRGPRARRSRRRPPPSPARAAAEPASGS